MWDVRFGADYGCLDLWAEVLRRVWDVIWKSDGMPGSFLWEWQDRAVADKCPTKLYQYDPVTGIQYRQDQGPRGLHGETLGRTTTLSRWSMRLLPSAASSTQPQSRAWPSYTSPTATRSRTSQS